MYFVPLAFVEFTAGDLSCTKIRNRACLSFRNLKPLSMARTEAGFPAFVCSVSWPPVLSVLQHSVCQLEFVPCGETAITTVSELADLSPARL